MSVFLRISANGIIGLPIPLNTLDSRLAFEMFYVLIYNF